MSRCRMRRKAMGYGAFYRQIRPLFAVAWFALLAAPRPVAAQAPATACETLRGFTAPDVAITAATTATAPVPLCKIDGVIGREIHFSLWLPDTWNGMFVMGGQGGYAGRVESQALAMGALEKGFAVAGTDTGHVGTGGGTDGS